MFCQAAVPSFSAKLSCQTVLLMDKLEDRWLKNRQKWEKYRKVWQKPTKSGRRQTKMTEKLSKCGVLLIIFCQASHFCPAKLPFLSCQANTPMDWMEAGNFSILVIPVLLRENIFIAVNDSLCEGLRLHKMVMG